MCSPLINTSSFYSALFSCPWIKTSHLWPAHFPSQQSLKPVGSISLMILFSCPLIVPFTPLFYYYCTHSQALIPPVYPVRLEMIVPKTQQQSCHSPGCLLAHCLHIKLILITNLLRHNLPYFQSYWLWFPFVYTINLINWTTCWNHLIFLEGNRLILLYSEGLLECPEAEVQLI